MTVNNLLPIRRFRDNRYVFEKDNDQKLEFKIKGKKLDSESSYNIVAKAQQALDAQTKVKKSASFKYGGYQWTVVKATSWRWLFRILSYIFPFLHFAADDRVKKYVIKKSIISPCMLNKRNKAEGKQNKNWKKITKNSFDYTNFKAASELFIKIHASNATNPNPMLVVSEEDYKKGVRAAVTLGNLTSSHDKRYVDPFTELSTLAFQKYESLFDSHDHKTPLSCDYRFILIENNKLMLVHKKSSLITEENLKAAAEIYVDYVQKLYGMPKFNNINFAYNVDFVDVEEFRKWVQKASLETQKNWSKKSLATACFKKIPLEMSKKLIQIIKRDQKKEKDKKITVGDFRKWLASIGNKFVEKKFSQEESDKFLSNLIPSDLNHIRELTPEHVYRFNVGTTNVEFQDIDECKTALRQALEETLDAPKETPLKEACYKKMPFEMLRKLIQALKKNEEEKIVTLEDFRNWMDSKEDGFNSSEDFNELVSILMPSQEELERSYTGRKIYGMIKSAYSTAGDKSYKPWVDQQELVQIRKEIEECPSQEAYHEILSHVVVKKHLARRHQSEGYRVGALIPAPPLNPGGDPRWYSVTSCVSNGYIYSYTLESPIHDPTLPALKLYRSTASSQAALFSEMSVINDFNHINSPGIMGIKMIEDYEKGFFHRRTIPLWVGYHHMGSQKLKENKVAETIEAYQKANEQLLHSQKKKLERKTLVEVVQENDAILEMLFLIGSGIFKDIKETPETKEFASFFRTFINRYIQPKKNKRLTAKKIRENAKRLLEDAELLKVLLQQIIPQYHAKPQYQELIKVAIKDLDENVIKEKVDRQLKKKVKKFIRKSYEPLETHAESVQKLLQEGNEDEALVELKKWGVALQKVAEDLHENIESKRHDDLCIIGHSLGGACGQVAQVHYFAKNERLPLPGKRSAGYFFDDPKINFEYNELFKKFGNDHVQLIKHLNVKFEVFRREEASDIIPLGGDVHLGATFTDQESADVGQWLKFNAAVNRRLESSHKTGIADSSFVHETRYLTGAHQRTFNQKPPLISKIKGKKPPVKLTKEQKKIIYDPKAFPRNDRGPLIAGPRDMITTNYDTRIQGIFDTRGRKGATKLSKGKKVYHHIRKSIWKIPGFFDMIFIEKNRKSPNSFWMALRKFVYAKTRSTHLADTTYLDKLGCLAVELRRGVVSAV